MRETTKLDEYYNKFNEEKRLDSRHGRIEYRTSRAYIDKYLHVIDSNRNDRNVAMLQEIAVCISRLWFGVEILSRHLELCCA